MSDITPFVLPDGANVSVGGNTLVLRHEGDVVLEQTLGRRLVRLESGGDVTLRVRRVTGAIRAAGLLTLEGDADCEELRGRVIELGAVEVRARAIVATEKVVIRGTRLAVDVIVAPEVVIDAKASGRVRVVDCLHEQPPSRVRGCLSLEDYEADFGGVAEFLARRGVEPVSPLPEPRDEASVAPPSADPDGTGEAVDDEAAYEPEPYEATVQMSALLVSDPSEAATVMMTGPVPDDDDDPYEDDDIAEVIVGGTRPIDPSELDAPASEVDAAGEPELVATFTDEDEDQLVAFEQVIDEDDEDDIVYVHQGEEVEEVDEAHETFQTQALTGLREETADPALVSMSDEDDTTDTVHVVQMVDDWDAADGDYEEIEDLDDIEEVVEDETTEGAFQPRRRQAPPSRVEKQVARAWERLIAAYEGHEVPAAVHDMGALVSEGRGAEVSEAIDVFWRETLRDHLGRGAPPPRGAVLAFHAIRAVAA